MSTKKKGGDPVNRSLRNAVRVFKDHGGVLRTVDVLRAGVHQRTLYAMREAGIVARHGRGGGEPLGMAGGVVQAIGSSLGRYPA